MQTAQMNAALAKVQTTESNPAARGIIVAVDDPQFNVELFIKKMVSQFLNYHYDPAAGDPRTVLVCMRRDDAIKRLMGFVNSGMQPRGGNMLKNGFRPGDVGPLTYSTYGMLRACRLPADTFDFVVMNALQVGEMNDFRQLFAAMDVMFRVIVMPRRMATAAEFQRWPGLERYTVKPQPAALQHPAQPGN